MNKNLVCAVLMTSSLASFESFAEDVNVKLLGGKNPERVVGCPNNACVIPNLVADTYTLTFVDTAGQNIQDSNFDCKVSSTRDAAAILKDGKRIHKPFLINKETQSVTLPIPEDEANFSIVCIATHAVTASLPLASAEKVAPNKTGAGNLPTNLK
jgi:hypothetical protein